MHPDDVDPMSGCRLPLPRREDLDDAGQRTYDNLADPEGKTIRGLRGPGGIMLHSPELSRRARPLNRYLRYEAGLGGRVRELAMLTIARELNSQFEWAAHEPEAVAEGVSQEIIDIIKHRKNTSGLNEADEIVIELGREIFGARRVSSVTFARCLIIRPSQARRSRRADGQLCQHSGTSRRLRHAARSQSAAAPAATVRPRGRSSLPKDLRSEAAA